jgi:1,4-alpha-glucan branching enzyme
MLFMGEEWAARQPFLFFVDFAGELADSVRNGRRAEFARFPEFADPGARDRIPDPVAPDTFQRSKLDWGDTDREPHRSTLAWYRRILAMRRTEIVPRIPSVVGSHYEGSAEGLLLVEWNCATSEALVLQANLSSEPVRRAATANQSFWREGRVLPEELGAWSVELAMRTPRPQ